MAPSRDWNKLRKGKSMKRDEHQPIHYAQLNGSEHLIHINDLIWNPFYEDCLRVYIFRSNLEDSTALCTFNTTT